LIMGTKGELRAYLRDDEVGGVVLLLWLLFLAHGRCITTSSLFTITYYLTLAGLAVINHPHFSCKIAILSAIILATLPTEGLQ